MAIGLEIQNFNSDGDYVSTTQFQRNNYVAVFEATPQITVVPPYQKITAEWDQEANENLFLDDLVEQSISDFEAYGVTTQYWKATGDSVYSWLTKNDSLLFAFVPPTPLSPLTGPFNVGVFGPSTVTSVNLESNYISLENPIYVTGTLTDPFYVDFKFDVTIKTSTDVDSNDLEALEQMFFYELAIGNDVLVTNKEGFASKYNFEFKSASGKKITASVEVENIPIFQDGYVDIKVHPAISDTSNTYVVEAVILDTLELIASKEYESTFELTRAIDYTTETELELPIAATAFDTVTTRFNIADSVDFTGVTKQIEAVSIQIEVDNTYTKVDRVVTDWVDYTFNTYYVLFSETFYNYLTQYPTSLYVQKAGETTKTALTEYSLYYNSETEVYGIAQYTETYVDGDQLWILVDEETINITDKNIVLDYWKRFNQDEEETYVNAYLKAFHSVNATPLKKIEGNVMRLLFPLDLLEFNYLTPAEYQLTDLKLNLTTGETSVVVMETQNKNITDYE